MPQTKPVAKPQMTQEQILALVGGIQDLHDLCLMYVGIFCGPRASEVLGLQWKSWTGISLIPLGTTGDRSSGAWHAQGCTRGLAPREHPHYGRCLHADHRE
jgi:hypothetical protein